MGSSRVRLKKGTAVKRWKKGHSAASNPSTSKHREAAKGTLAVKRIFHKGVENSLLTKKNVDIHEAAAADGDDVGEDSVCSQSTTSTCYSFIETAHPVFHKVKKLWMSPLESHREVCAVLAAVSEVVKSSDGKETEMKYFIALLSALQSAEEEKSVVAILLLLNIVMPEISDVVLRSQFTEISKLLMDKLTCYERSSSTALLKSLVTSSLLLLSVQDGVVWSDQSTLHFLQLIINYVTHPKPKVRKAAHEGLAHMIQSGLKSTDDVTVHPAAVSLAKFCHNQFEQGNSSTGTLHVLNLLKDTLAHMSSQVIKKLCEKILKLLLLGNTLMRSQCLQTLHGLFSRITMPQGLTVKLNGQLISALYDYQPKMSDVQLVAAWTVVMETAHMRLMRFDKNICLAHLPKLIQSLMTLLMSPSPGSRDTICNSLKSLIEQCLQDCPNKEIIETCFRSIEAGLKFQYQSVWGHVLQLLGHFYHIHGNSQYSIISQSLISLCELRNTTGFAHTEQLDGAFAKAVEAVGPKKILESVPLQLDPSSDLCNDWILLILRDHVSKVELSYFVENLLPVAMTIKLKAEKLANQNPLKAAMLRTLYSQIWDVLPAFCTSPSDVDQSFKSIARLLGEGLREQPLLRPTICRSLRLLIETTNENATSIAELSKYAKNYLPLLFNIYTESSSTGDSNSFILECIRSYASITDLQLLEKFVSEICSRFKDNDVKIQMRLIDLLTVFCDKVGVVLLGQLYQIIVSSWIKVEDGSLQKKSYSLLEKLLSCSSPSLEQFLQDHVTDIQQLMIEGTSCVKPAAKRLRMKCIHHFVHHVIPLSVEFLCRVIPEVILSVKEVKEKTRSLAITILVDIAHSYDQQSINEYFKLILAGLAGSAHMISATVVSLARLVYVFHDVLSEEMLRELVKIVTMQLSSKCKEIVKSSLDFIKIIIGILSKQELLSCVDSLFEAVFSWDKNFQQHFHFKMKIILERLIKKLGYDVIESLVPKQHKKLIAHIHKMLSKQKKKKEQKVNERDSKIHKPSYEELLADQDGEDGGKDVGRWIKDDVDDPIDLMDHTALQHILASKPVAVQPTKTDFITTEDGRLLIDEDEQCVLSTENKRKRMHDVDSSHDLTSDSREGSANKRQKVVTAAGSQYRSQRAQGDMKRRGKPDPYAYIPLNRQSLNKRKKCKTVGYYGGLLWRAHVGSSRGRRQLTCAKQKLKK